MRPYDVTLRQLQYAVAVADLGRFHAAASACGVSQPGLSAQLASLEDALGFRVFDRDKKRVTTTPAGAAFLQRARRVLAEMNDLVAAAGALVDPFAGALRIGVLPTIAPYVLPDLSPALAKAFPKLTLHWREDRTSRLVEEVSSGALDAALLALEADLGGLAHVVVAPDPFVLAVPKGHALDRKQRVRVDELEGQNVLLLDDGHCMREQALSFCARRGAREAGFRATSISTLAQMVASGAGVTLLPSISVPLENRGRAFVVRELAPPAPKRTVVLVFRRGASLEPALRTFAKAMADAWPVHGDKGRDLAAR